MKILSKLTLTAAALSMSAVALPQIAAAGSYGKTAMSHSKPTVVGLAAGNDNFSTLVTAVKAADLVDTLSSDGPFTVFAPDNAAFSKIPSDTLGSLLKPENKGALTGILTYHVVPGKVTAADLVAAIEDNGGHLTIKTAEGGKLTAMTKGAHVFLKDEQGNKSKITATDLKASNGVIHVIDSVVMPN